MNYLPLAGKWIFVPEFAFVTRMMAAMSSHSFGSLISAMLGSAFGTMYTHITCFVPISSAYCILAKLWSPFHRQLEIVESFGRQVITTLDRRLEPHQLAKYNVDILRSLFLILLATMLMVIFHCEGLRIIVNKNQDTSERCGPSNHPPPHSDKVVRLLCHYFIVIRSRLGFLNQDTNADTVVQAIWRRWHRLLLFHLEIMRLEIESAKTASTDCPVARDSMLDEDHDPDLPSKAMGDDVFSIPENPLSKLWKSKAFVHQEGMLIHPDRAKIRKRGVSLSSGIPRTQINHL